MKHRSLATARKSIPFFPIIPLVPLALIVANVTVLLSLFRRVDRIERRVLAA